MARDGSLLSGRNLSLTGSVQVFVRAVWKNTVIARSDDTVMVEGNHYFPRSSVDDRYLAPSDKHTVCHWKGVASYFDVVVDGEVNRSAAWYYPDPAPAALQIKDRIAFWRGVSVEE